MMLRYSTPGSVRLVDLGPASPAPLRGFTHRGHEVPGGSFARPLPAPGHREPPRTCGQCGEPLPARRGPVGNLPLWCSQACRQRASRARRRAVA